MTDQEARIRELEAKVAGLEAEVERLKSLTRTPFMLWPTWGGKRIGPGVQLYSPHPIEDLEWLLRLGGQ